MRKIVTTRVDGWISLQNGAIQLILETEKSDPRTLLKRLSHWKVVNKTLTFEASMWMTLYVSMPAGATGVAVKTLQQQTR